MVTVLLRSFVNIVGCARAAIMRIQLYRRRRVIAAIETLHK